MLDCQALNHFCGCCLAGDFSYIEFYAEESSEVEQKPIDSRSKTKPKLNQDDGFVQDIQKGLQGSVRAVI